MLRSAGVSSEGGDGSGSARREAHQLDALAGFHVHLGVVRVRSGEHGVCQTPATPGRAADDPRIAPAGMIRADPCAAAGRRCPSPARPGQDEEHAAGLAIDLGGPHVADGLPLHGEVRAHGLRGLQDERGLNATQGLIGPT